MFDGGRAIGHQGRLAGQDVVDAGAQQRPLCPGDVEVAPEIEQRALTDGVSDALGVDEAMGEVGLSVLGAAGLGAPNEHTPHDSGWTCSSETRPMRLWHCIVRDQTPNLWNQ